MIELMSSFSCHEISNDEHVVFSTRQRECIERSTVGMVKGSSQQGLKATSHHQVLHLNEYHSSSFIAVSCHLHGEQTCT